MCERHIHVPMDERQETNIVKTFLIVLYATLMFFLGLTIYAGITDEAPVTIISQPTSTPAPMVKDGMEVMTLAERIGGDDATQIALAIMYESQRSGLEPNLILGIIRTENPWLKPDTVNWYGAVGLMQVVGWLHAGDYPECGADLGNVYTNICYGVRIFEDKLRHAQGNVPLALLYYSGCSGETYREGCEVYSNYVSDRGEM